MATDAHNTLTDSDWLELYVYAESQLDAMSIDDLNQLTQELADQAKEEQSHASVCN